MCMTKIAARETSGNLTLKEYYGDKVTKYLASITVTSTMNYSS